MRLGACGSSPFLRPSCWSWRLGGKGTRDRWVGPDWRKGPGAPWRPGCRLVWPGPGPHVSPSSRDPRSLQPCWCQSPVTCGPRGPGVALEAGAGSLGRGEGRAPGLGPCTDGEAAGAVAFRGVTVASGRGSRTRVHPADQAEETRGGGMPCANQEGVTAALRGLRPSTGPSGLHRALGPEARVGSWALQDPTAVSRGLSWKGHCWARAPSTGPGLPHGTQALRPPTRSAGRAGGQVAGVPGGRECGSGGDVCR